MLLSRFTDDVNTRFVFYNVFIFGGINYTLMYGRGSIYVIDPEKIAEYLEHCFLAAGKIFFSSVGLIFQHLFLHNLRQE